MSTIATSAEYSKSFVSIPAGAGEPQTGEPKAGATPPVMTKILLRGGHATTIHGKTPHELSYELVEARAAAAEPLYLYFVHHHQDYGAEPNGVAIDLEAVVGLIRIG